MIAFRFYIILPFDWEITPNFTRAILCHYKQCAYATIELTKRSQNVLLRQVNQDQSSVNRYHCELVGRPWRPIKRQRRPLAGRVISDRFLFALYFCEESSAHSVWQQRLLHQRYKAWTIIGGRHAVGTWSAVTVGARAHCRRPPTGFIGRFLRLIPTVNCTLTLDLEQNGVL